MKRPAPYVLFAKYVFLPPGGKKDKLYGIILCLYSGLRIGELIALEWHDIDFTKGILTVSKSCHDGKTGSSSTSRKRPIPVV